MTKSEAMKASWVKRKAQIQGKPQVSFLSDSDLQLMANTPLINYDGLLVASMAQELIFLRRFYLQAVSVPR